MSQPGLSAAAFEGGVPSGIAPTVPMPSRPLANLVMTIVAPTDLVVIPYYVVVALDQRVLQRFAGPHVDRSMAAEIYINATIVSVYSPDAHVAMSCAQQRSTGLGWQPILTAPQQVSQDGYGTQPFEVALRRPRPEPPVPMDHVIQHMQAIKTQLYSEETPGWMLVWDTLGNPYRPCGLTYGCRGLAVGQPCGRTEGCDLDPNHGPCLWGRQALQAGMAERGPVQLYPPSPAEAPPQPPLPPPPRPRVPRGTYPNAATVGRDRVQPHPQFQGVPQARPQQRPPGQAMPQQRAPQPGQHAVGPGQRAPGQAVAPRVPLGQFARRLPAPASEQPATAPGYPQAPQYAPPSAQYQQYPAQYAQPQPAGAGEPWMAPTAPPPAPSVAASPVPPLVETAPPAPLAPMRFDPTGW